MPLAAVPSSVGQCCPVRLALCAARCPPLRWRRRTWPTARGSRRGPGLAGDAPAPSGSVLGAVTGPVARGAASPLAGDGAKLGAVGASVSAWSRRPAGGGGARGSLRWQLSGAGCAAAWRFEAGCVWGLASARELVGVALAAALGRGAPRYAAPLAPPRAASGGRVRRRAGALLPRSVALAVPSGGAGGPGEFRPLRRAAGALVWKMQRSTQGEVPAPPVTSAVWQGPSSARGLLFMRPAPLSHLLPPGSSKPGQEERTATRLRRPPVRANIEQNGPFILFNVSTPNVRAVDIEHNRRCCSMLRPALLDRWTFPHPLSVCIRVSHPGPCCQLEVTAAAQAARAEGASPPARAPRSRKAASRRRSCD